MLKNAVSKTKAILGDSKTLVLDNEMMENNLFDDGPQDGEDSNKKHDR